MRTNTTDCHSTRTRDSRLTCRPHGDSVILHRRRPRRHHNNYILQSLSQDEYIMILLVFRKARTARGVHHHNLIIPFNVSSILFIIYL
jgi:hypothetical protein